MILLEKSIDGSLARNSRLGCGESSTKDNEENKSSLHFFRNFIIFNQTQIIDWSDTQIKVRLKYSSYPIISTYRPMNVTLKTLKMRKLPPLPSIWMILSARLFDFKTFMLQRKLINNLRGFNCFIIFRRGLRLQSLCYWRNETFTFQILKEKLEELFERPLI